MCKDNCTEDRNDQKILTTRKLITLLVCMIFIFSIFHNVSAVDSIYTIDDNNSNVTINTEEKLTVSLRAILGYEWNFHSSNSSVLRLVDEGGYIVNPGVPGSSVIRNWTFEGRNRGNTTLTFIYSQSWGDNDTIIRTFTLNVTSTVENSFNVLWPAIIAITITIMVSAAVIIIRMKGGRKD